MNHDPLRLGPVLYLISLAGSLVLIIIGVFFSLNHTGAAAVYGVAVPGGTGNAWISSAALRDLAYGCLTLTFTLLRDRRAIGLCLLFGAIIPVGDAIVVLRHSPSPPEYLPFHLSGALMCLVLAAVLLRPGRS
jgi:Domain of unknown function (DUF4267)